MATIEILHPPPPMAIPPIMGRSFIFYRDMPTRASSLRRRWVRRDRITQLRLSSGHLSMSSFAPDQLGNRMRQKAGYPAGAPLAPPGSKAYGLSFFCVDFMNIRSCGSGRTENHDPVRLSGDLWSDVVVRCRDALLDERGLRGETEKSPLLVPQEWSSHRSGPRPAFNLE